MDTPILDTVQRQFDGSKDRNVIEFGDMSGKDFRTSAIPFTVGFCGGSHGVVHIEYEEKRIILKRVKQ